MSVVQIFPFLAVNYWIMIQLKNCPLIQNSMSPMHLVKAKFFYFQQQEWYSHQIKHRERERFIARPWTWGHKNPDKEGVKEKKEVGMSNYIIKQKKRKNTYNYS